VEGAIPIRKTPSIAERIPGARKGTVEIRPVSELAGLPKLKF
jgi:hypothetical protein